MPRKRYSTEQIVTKLRQAEVALGRGLRTPQVCKKLGISEHADEPVDLCFGVGDQMATAAAIDRLVHHAVVLEFDVPSFRTDPSRPTSPPSPPPVPRGLLPPQSVMWPCLVRKVRPRGWR